VAAALAAAFIGEGQPAEIVSADSRQLYRRMDIGTGKDLADYRVGDICVPLHMTDTQEPGTRYDLYQYQRDATAAIADIKRRGALPILCGGSGLYIEAVLRGYALSPVPQNPQLRQQLEGLSLKQLTDMLAELKQQNGSAMHNTTDVDSAQRAIRAIEIETYNRDTPTERRHIQAADSLVVGIAIDRDERRRKISRRLDDRLREGMVEEVRSLLDEGIRPDDLIYYGLEYRYVTEYLLGHSTFQEMHDRLETAIHQFAKRQMTWFRGMERRGTHIHWIDAAMPMADKLSEIRRLYRDYKS
jgi:tRNA dimethylallyltransferase